MRPIFISLVSFVLASINLSGQDMQVLTITDTTDAIHREDRIRITNIADWRLVPGQDYQAMKANFAGQSHQAKTSWTDSGIC